MFELFHLCCVGFRDDAHVPSCAPGVCAHVYVPCVRVYVCACVSACMCVRVCARVCACISRGSCCVSCLAAQEWYMVMNQAFELRVVVAHSKSITGPWAEDVVWQVRCICCVCCVRCVLLFVALHHE